MDEFFKSLPKPVLAGLVILAGLIFFYFNDPPKTLCDVQKENLQEQLVGKVFPKTVKKKTIPPILERAQEACQMGNSAGSCLEYFGILKIIARGILDSSAQCRPEVGTMDGIQSRLEVGLYLMANIAWGTHPPEPDSSRFAWFQESELKLFCELQDAYREALGPEALTEFRNKIMAGFPGNPPPHPRTANIPDKPPKAVTTMSERELWNRSLFSVRCDNFR